MPCCHHRLKARKTYCRSCIFHKKAKFGCDYCFLSCTILIHYTFNNQICIFYFECVSISNSQYFSTFDGATFTCIGVTFEWVICTFAEVMKWSTLSITARHCPTFIPRNKKTKILTLYLIIINIYSNYTIKIHIIQDDFKCFTACYYDKYYHLWAENFKNPCAKLQWYMLLNFPQPLKAPSAALVAVNSQKPERTVDNGPLNKGTWTFQTFLS